MIKPISSRRFNAYCYVRIPHLLINFEEIAWFEAFNTKLLGTIVFDTDDEFNYMILARDKRKIFRAWDFGTSYPTREKAEEAMMTAFAKYEKDGQTIYPQGDEKTLPQEFLIPRVPEGKLHPYYKILNTKGHEGAKFPVSPDFIIPDYNSSRFAICKTKCKKPQFFQTAA